MAGGLEPVIQTQLATRMSRLLVVEYLAMADYFTTPNLLRMVGKAPVGRNLLILI